ncbi:hypothetical protein SAMN05216404_11377 [Nitrosospira multiformis]|uniref:Uncharacterized protein n=1 Tax=Nitrosospira multiformis TaxID=1231 RepID=A0A1H8MR66_9PROT|nr:hypothetical protein SAMN05216404_11377 [Nitrosospira multiformis]
MRKWFGRAAIGTSERVLEEMNFLRSYHELILAKSLFQLLAVAAPPVLVQILYHDFIYDDVIVNCGAILLLPQSDARRAGVAVSPPNFSTSSSRTCSKR